MLLFSLIWVKNWFSQRLAFLDQNWGYEPTAISKPQGYFDINVKADGGKIEVNADRDLLQVELRRSMMQAIDAGTEAYLTNLFGHNPYVPAGHVDMIMGLIRGGMPTVDEPDVPKETFYKPETSWNYEIGTHLNLFDGRLKADLAAFWIETRDLQISQMAEQPSGLRHATCKSVRWQRADWDA